MSTQQEILLQNKIMEIENKMHKLRSEIKSKMFIFNPVKVTNELTKSYQSMIRDSDINNRDISTNRLELDNTQIALEALRNGGDKKSIGTMNHKLDGLSNKIKYLHTKNDVIEKELLQLKEQINTFRVDPAHSEYKQLYSTREIFTTEINKYKTGNSILTYDNFIADDNYFSLASRLAPHLTNESMWYEKFKLNHLLTLTNTNPDGTSLIEFKLANSSESIQITNRSLDYTGKIDDDNKLSIVPTMIQLFLKIVENTGLTGCIIKGETPDITKFMVDCLTKEIMSRPDKNKFGSFKINGDTIAAIIRREPKPASNLIHEGESQTPRYKI